MKFLAPKPCNLASFFYLSEILSDNTRKINDYQSDNSRYLNSLAIVQLIVYKKAEVVNNPPQGLPIFAL